MNRDLGFDYCEVDDCHAKGELYAPWPSCRDCRAAVCPDHQAPGSLKDEDERGISCLCVRCAEGSGLGIPADLLGAFDFEVTNV